MFESQNFNLDPLPGIIALLFIGIAILAALDSANPCVCFITLLVCWSLLIVGAVGAAKVIWKLLLPPEFVKTPRKFTRRDLRRMLNSRGRGKSKKTKKDSEREVSEDFLQQDTRFVAASGGVLPLPEDCDFLFRLAAKAAWFVRDLNDVRKGQKTLFEVMLRFLTENLELSEIIAYAEACKTTLTPGREFQDMARKFFLSKKSEEFEATSLLSDMRDLVDTGRALPQSELWRVSSRTILGLLSLPLAKSLGLNPSASGLLEFQERNLKKAEFSSTYDMVLCILDMGVTMAEVGHLCYAEKSIKPLFAANTAVAKFIEEVKKFKTYNEGRPYNEKFDVDHALILADNATMIGRPLLKHPDFRVFVQAELRTIDIERSALYYYAQGSAHRRAPFGVLIYGTPGIGKSTVVNNIATHYHRVVTKFDIYPHLGWEPNVNQYTKNPHDEFDSGYRGAVHWFVLFDDLASETAHHIKNGMASSIESLIRWVNSVGMTSNQADLSDKGKIPIMPKLVVATTNTKNLNAHFAVEEPSAVLRRLPIVITPRLKPEFLDEATGQMRKTTVPEFDAWNYSVDEVRIHVDHDKQVATAYYEPVKGSLPNDVMTSAEMYKFLTSKIIAHEQNTLVMQQANSSTDSREYCKCDNCLPIKLCDKCNVMEACSGDIPAKGLFKKIIDFIVLTLWSMYATRIRRAFWKRYWTFKIYYMLPFWDIFLSIVTIYDGGFFSIGLLVSRLFGYEAVQRRILARTQARLTARFLKFATAAAFLGTAGYIGYYAMSITRGACSDEEMNSSENSLPPEEEDRNTKNIWATKDHGYRVPSKAVNDNGTQIINRLRNCTVRITVTGMRNNAEALFSQNAVNLGDGTLLTTAHAFQGLEDFDMEMLYGPRAPINPASRAKLGKSSLTFFDQDLVLIRVASANTRASPREYMCTEPSPMLGRAMLLGRDKVGNLICENGWCSEISRQSYRHGETLITLPKALSFMYDDKRSTTRGDCGMMLLVQTGRGWVFSGIVCAGLDGHSTGLAIHVADSMIPEYTELYAAGDDMDYFLEGNKSSGPLHPPSERNIANYVRQECDMFPLGSFSTRHRPRTRVTGTAHAEELTAVLNPKDAYGPPLMTAKKNDDGTWLNPWLPNLEAQGKPANVPEEALFDAARGLYKDIADRCDLSQLSPLPLQEAINGIPGDPFIESIKMSTSAGFPAPGPKRNVMVQDHDTGLWSFPPELLESYQTLQSLYSENKRAHVLMMGHLKDEPTALRKVAIGKTRVFTGCGVDFTVLVRSQFLRHAKMFMTNNHETECAVGMNCYSTAWGDLYNYLTKNGEVCDRSIAGDFSKFDKNMQAAAIRAAFEVLIMLSHTSGNFNETDLRIQRGIATDLSQPVVNYNGDVFLFMGGNSSGHPLTVIINSIVNSIYMRVAYGEITKKSLESFRTDVRLITYGDDNLLVSDVPEFNHSAIQEVLAKYDISYTMADKDSESTAFLPMEKVNFLKRTFRVLDGRIVAPLELESTYKSLLCYQARTSITEGEQAAQSYLSARREWALHGKQVFTELVTRVHPILASDRLISIHFIRQHEYTYEQTLKWIYGEEEEEEEVESSTIFSAASGPVRRVRFLDQIEVIPTSPPAWLEEELEQPDREPVEVPEEVPERPPAPPPNVWQQFEPTIGPFAAIRTSATDWWSTSFIGTLADSHRDGIPFFWDTVAALKTTISYWSGVCALPIFFSPIAEEVFKRIFSPLPIRLGFASALALQEIKERGEMGCQAVVRLGCHILYACFPFPAAVQMHAGFNCTTFVLGIRASQMPWDVKIVCCYVVWFLMMLAIVVAESVAPWFVTGGLIRLW